MYQFIYFILLIIMKINLLKTRKQVFMLVRKTKNVVDAMRVLDEKEKKIIMAYVMFALWIEVSSFYECYNLLLS